MKKNLIKNAAIIMAAAAFVTGMAITADSSPFGLLSLNAQAAGWQQDANGWRWQNDDGAYITEGWHWLDGNGDGVAECYSFRPDGYMYADTVTPDGYTVNADGAWTEDGTVKTQGTNPEPAPTPSAGINVQVTYNADGINTDVIYILDHTKEENAEKYGEADVRTDGYGDAVTYNNGLWAEYDSYHAPNFPYDKADCVRYGLFDGQPCSVMFRDATGSPANAAAAERMLRQKGYDASSDIGICVITIDDRYQLQWSDFGGRERIRIVKQDSYKYNYN